ncbi:uncharacterized protein LOC117295404 isoform X1 [Asterias rubens]|uniref:uncharacterized protein LOC117295404 isoform X1 n=1 Tax=Asterias rubens TaxID=7604 RepID=UPI0014559247|nr:uncharacterized protein LOC117295404 isoform X1 [Asterias rubens]
MAGHRPSASTPTSSKSPLGKSLHNSSLLSRSGLNDTLHSTQSLSGRASIMTYNNTQYPSATAALAAYISDFEDANPLSQTYHRTVEDLFTPRSVMLRTVDRSLETGVRDTSDEWRRYTSKKLLDESFSEMVQGDVERERAESMQESSRLLTADLSPLPGSSVITEVESGTSLSTDLLLHAPLYPTLTQPPSQRPKRNPTESNLEKGSIRREYEQRFAGSSHGNQTTRGRTHDSSIRSCVRREERGSGYRVNTSPVKKSVSGTVGDALKSGQPLPTPIPGKADWRGFSTSNVGSSKHDIHKRKRNLGNENVASPYASKMEGGRRPPSWIQDLDTTGASSLVSQARLGGRAPPSWIQDIDKTGLSGVATETGISGRAPPSWVQDLDVSGISSLVRSKREGGRPPPSWIQELNSTIISEKQSNFRSLKSFENTLPASHTLMRTNSADDLLSEAHRRKGNSLELGANPRVKRASSFTTDDLIMASPTGKEFQRPSHNSRGQYSSRETNSNSIPSQFNIDSYFFNGTTALTEEHLPSNSIKTSSIRKDSRFLNLQTESSKRGSLRSTRGTANLKLSSLKMGPAASLASTPKRSVAFEVTSARRSLNGYFVERGSGSQSSRRGQRFDARQTERTLAEDERQREDTLLLRAQKVLDDARAAKSQSSSSHRYHGNTDNHDNSLLTDEVLDGDRSWEKNLPSLKPLKSAQGTEEHDANHNQDIVAKFLDDCLKSVDEQTQKLTGGLQPGPVEALKNMLFTLQGMAPNSQASSPTKDTPVPTNYTSAPTNEAGEVVSSIRSTSSWSPQSGSKATSREKSFLKYTRRDTGSSGSGTDFEEAPGGKSLQRAMEHLSRLKYLVNGGSNPSTQQSSTNGQVMSS